MSYGAGDFRYTLIRIKSLTNLALKQLDGIEGMPDDADFRETLITLSAEIFEQAEHLDKIAHTLDLPTLDGKKTTNKEMES